MRKSHFFFAGLILFSFLSLGCNEDVRPLPGTESHDFGRVLLGQRVFGPSCQWTNYSKNVVDLALPHGSIDPPFEQDTAYVSQNVQPKGQTPSVNVIFQPTQLGRFEKTICPITTSQVRLKPVQVSGEGVARKEWGCLKLGGGYLLALDPSLPFNSTPLDMGDIRVGDHSEKTINIENHASSPSLVHIDWIDPGYWLDANGNNTFSIHDSSAGPDLMSTSVPAGGSHTVIVQFTPHTTGSFLLILRLNDGQASTKPPGMGLGITFGPPWKLPPPPRAWINPTGEAYLVVTGKAHRGE